MVLTIYGKECLAQQVHTLYNICDANGGATYTMLGLALTLVQFEIWVQGSAKYGDSGYGAVMAVTLVIVVLLARVTICSAPCTLLG